MTSTQTPTAPAAPIEALRFRDDFVSSLPGDPLATNATRQVHDACYSRVLPTPVAAPRLLALVPDVAELIGLSLAETPKLVDVLAGNDVVTGMAPYAACYGGHQFGAWAGQLGDGRAITLGEVENARGERWELQLKGAGPTPYSRRADGRAVLRSSLRELVCSEAMHHLGVPTTRALSLVTTGDRVVRDMFYDGRPEHEPGAIVCRVAPSFLRFGSYQLHASRGDVDTLRTLVGYTIDRFFPHLVRPGALDVAGLLAEVCRRTAVMVVAWMRTGFVHGVMNTDNMSILGLTIDYGPYGWLESYDPSWTPNTTDAERRRYRFGNQPAVAFWNLVELGRSLGQLVDDVEPLERALHAFRDEHAARERTMLLAKLGLTPRDDVVAADDDALLATLPAVLQAVETDMTLFYRQLATVPTAPDGRSSDAHAALLRDAWYAPDDVTGAQRIVIEAWLERYLDRALRERIDDAARRRRMDAVNPLYVPRNYLVQQVVEQSLGGDRAPLHALLEVLREPYVEQPGRGLYAAKRPEWARHKPGSSMLSCSS